MGSVRPMPSRPPEPLGMHAHAVDNLRYIRRTMERAGSFTAVPGNGGIAMGAVALAAAFLASRMPSAWLAIWLVAAAAACAVGIAAAIRKGRRDPMGLLAEPGRKFLMGLAPPLLAGAILTAALWRTDQLELAPGAWMLLYGAGIVTGGAASVRPVPAMGLCFMAVGTLALFAPQGWANPLLAVGFGGLHILFGSIIAVKYGG